MDFLTFKTALLDMGATMQDVFRLDHEGRDSARDAHIDMWESGEMPECATRNDFESLCVWIGRDFVIDNVGTDLADSLFLIHSEV